MVKRPSVSLIRSHDTYSPLRSDIGLENHSQQETPVEGYPPGFRLFKERRLTRSEIKRWADLLLRCASQYPEARFCPMDFRDWTWAFSRDELAYILSAVAERCDTNPPPREGDGDSKHWIAMSYYRNWL